MLYADALRGWDSTGVIAISNDGGFHIAKEASQATSFIDDYLARSEHKSFLAKGQGLIGHNRKKTMGAVKDETSHPFVVDKTFAMVHNGTLYNHEALAKTEVDSEALAIVLKRALDKPATERVEALNETLGEVWGAYAVAMFDQKEEVVHLLRNRERPLAVVETPDVVAFASEVGLALWCLNRNNISTTKATIKSLDEHKLYSIDCKTGKINEEQLTPKKATLPVQTQKRTGSNGSAITLTENEFYALRESFCNKSVTFYVDDYVGTSDPYEYGPDCPEVYLFGANDHWGFAHNISGVVKLDDAEFLADHSRIKRSKWRAKIVDMYYNPENGGVSITVENITYTTPESSPPVFGAADIKERIEYNDIIASYTEAEIRIELGSHKLRKWQRTALELELKGRKHAKSYYENSTTHH